MKRIIAMTGLLLITLGIFSCKNQSWSFPDFDYTTTYFPNQYPIRTLIFGDYTSDNSMDNQQKFLISAATGGVYEQKKDITVDFTVDNTLCDNLINTGNSNRSVKAMPSNWYTLSNPSQITIPKGSFSGGVTVTLSNDFTADTNSVSPYWAIPLKITGATGVDSVLQGRSGLTNPDPRIAGNWAITPKNFTIFVVRYVNEWHGKYLLRGTDIVSKVSDGTKVDSSKYHTVYLEGNAIVQLLTSRRNQVKYASPVKLTGGGAGTFEMKIDFTADNITQATMSTTTRFPKTVVSGTAKMVLGKDNPVDNKGNPEAWGNISRNTVYLSYTITDTPTSGTWKDIPLLHTVKDTLVFRDKAVVYADFTPKVVIP